MSKLETCFKPGDLTYGLAFVREEAINFLKEKGALQEDIAHTIDEYNISLLGHIPVGDVKDDNPLTYVESQDFLKNFSDVQQFHFFAKKFEGEKSKEDRFFGSMAYYKGPLTSGQGEMPLVPGRNGIVPFIKKRCKLGILWNLQRGKKIHFFIDEIDLKQCFGKSQSRYTFSELRFVYRNWEYLSKWHQEGRIQFWSKNKDGYSEVNPPWLEKSSSAQCAVYKPKNPDRYKTFFVADAARKKESSGIEEKKSSIPPASNVDEKSLNYIKTLSEEKLTKYGSKPRVFNFGPSHKQEAVELNKFIQGAKSLNEISEKLRIELGKFSKESDQKGYHTVLSFLFLNVMNYQRRYSPPSASL